MRGRGGKEGKLTRVMATSFGGRGEAAAARSSRKKGRKERHRRGLSSLFTLQPPFREKGKEGGGMLL